MPHSGFGMSKFGKSTATLLNGTLGKRATISHFQRDSDREKQNTSQPVMRITLDTCSNEVDWSKDKVLLSTGTQPGLLRKTLEPKKKSVFSPVPDGFLGVNTLPAGVKWSNRNT